MLLAALLACGVPDPRSDLAARIVDARPVKLDPEKALVEGKLFEACVGFKQRAKADPASPVWAQLLIAAARDPNCLSVAEGDALAAFGADKPEWADGVAEWRAGHGGVPDLTVVSPATKLRIALRGTDQGAVSRAAAEALKANSHDTFACAVLVHDAIERGELAEAESVSHCADSAELVRLRAAALDEGGRYEEAVSAYDKAGFSLHAAAILYQSLGDSEGALKRMDEPVPPAAIHQGWMAVVRGQKPDISGLDASPESTMLRAIAGDAAAVAELPGLPGIEPKVLAARLTGDPALVQTVVGMAPASRAILELDWRINHQQGGETLLVRSDIDHLALAGNPGRREAPLAGILPQAQISEEQPPIPLGTDEVGNAWRAARRLDTIARDQALEQLQADHPELRVLARIRARQTWGLPPLAGDPVLDAPHGIE